MEVESERKDGTNSLAKTIKHRDYKFSVEFDNGNGTKQKKVVESSTVKTAHDETERPGRGGQRETKVEDSPRNAYAGGGGNETKSWNERRTIKRSHLSPVGQKSKSPLRELIEPKGRYVGGISNRNENGELAIQARIRGPGPAQYLLPTTVGRNSVDFTKRQSPAFSFGSRSWSFKNDSPGPAYGVDSNLSSRGRDSRPSYSFGTKPRTPKEKNPSPGPGAYNTDSPPLWEKKAPHYSISPRTKARAVDCSPPPNSYKLPSTIGAHVPHRKGGPAASIYSRREHQGFAEDLAKTPGPARYGAFAPQLTKRRNPEYTLKGRTWAPGPKMDFPGPGAYNPQDVNSHIEQCPKFVLGVKHSEYVMPTITPADVD